MKYAIIGNGYIGNYLNKILDDSMLIEGRYDDYLSIQMLLYNHPNAIIINAAGTTGRPNIDWCESNKSKTVMGNILLPVMIAEECERQKRYWINIGSGCIYTGYEKEWTEDDEPNFDASFYSLTKKISQKIVNEYPYSCTLRIRMPIDPEMDDRCLITKLLDYAKKGNPIISGVRNSMTYLDDLANIIEFVSNNKLEGTFNAVNTGALSAGELLDIYKEFVDPSVTYNTMSYDDLMAKGYIKSSRSNCILSMNKLEEKGYETVNIFDRIIDVMNYIKYKKNLHDIYNPLVK